MSEGISYKEILDQKDAQHGFGHLHKKKKTIAKKMPIPESAKLRNQATNKKYGIPKSTKHDDYIDSNPREFNNK